MLVTALNRASPSGEQHFQLRVQRKEGDETKRDQVVQGLVSLDFLLSAEGHLQASEAGGVACSKLRSGHRGQEGKLWLNIRPKRGDQEKQPSW